MMARADAAGQLAEDATEAAPCGIERLAQKVTAAADPADAPAESAGVLTELPTRRALVKKWKAGIKLTDTERHFMRTDLGVRALIRADQRKFKFIFKAAFFAVLLVGYHFYHRLQLVLSGEAFVCVTPLVGGYSLGGFVSPFTGAAAHLAVEGGVSHEEEGTSWFGSLHPWSSSGRERAARLAPAAALQASALATIQVVIRAGRCPRLADGTSVQARWTDEARQGPLALAPRFLIESLAAHEIRAAAQGGDADDGLSGDRPLPRLGGPAARARVVAHGYVRFSAPNGSFLRTVFLSVEELVPWPFHPILAEGVLWWEGEAAGNADVRRTPEEQGSTSRTMGMSAPGACALRLAEEPLDGPFWTQVAASAPALRAAAAAASLAGRRATALLAARADAIVAALEPACAPVNRVAALALCAGAATGLTSPEIFTVSDDPFLVPSVQLDLTRGRTDLAVASLSVPDFRMLDVSACEYGALSSPGVWDAVASWWTPRPEGLAVRCGKGDASCSELLSTAPVRSALEAAGWAVVRGAKQHRGAAALVLRHSRPSCPLERELSVDDGMQCRTLRRTAEEDAVVVKES